QKVTFPKMKIPKFTF
nr:Chain C, Neuroblast differentiation-associated protein AHNAK [Homo sapiens]4HRG_D Chain D, Neuroblast differentiation-associated protein AHNAK [Homo sapiens]